MNTGFPQQQPLAFSAAVRSTPAPQHAAHLDLSPRPAAQPPAQAEEKSFEPRPKR